MGAPRIEIARVEDGYFARFVAGNGRVVWVTPGLHVDRRATVNAIELITGHVVETWNGTRGVMRACRSDEWVEVRDVDLRDVNLLEEV